VAAANLVADALPVTLDDVLEAWRLLEAHAGLGASDALHAGVMQNSAANTLLSVERDFDGVPDLKRIRPGAGGHLAS
jgi:predicted nucleic acid-binding protein